MANSPAARGRRGGPAWRWRHAHAAALAATLAITACAGVPAADGSAPAVRAAWQARAEAGDGTRLRDPFVLESAQATGTLAGTLYGIVDHRFDDVRRTLAGRAGWCAVLILDPNVHRCEPRAPSADGSPAAQIAVAFGESAVPVVFSFRPIAAGDEYLRVELAADEGPWGTRDQAIALEAAPLDASRTVVRLAFSQRFGFAARVALLAYFNTVGRGKVGFTVTGRDAHGRPVRVSDLRGGLERNMVRYYFAIVACLDSPGPAGDSTADRRVRAWLAMTERYPQQLQEAPGYLERKVPEVRQQPRD